MANDIIAEELERPRSHRENRKKNRGRKVDDNQAQAIAKFIRVQPRKARLVIDEIRGRYANEALNFLRFIPNRAAGYISKVLYSAMNNAANNHGLALENLKLIEARVDEGPRMKRVQPRAQGRAYRILKRTSHITIIVQEVEPQPRKPKKPTGSRAQAARAAKQAPKAKVQTAPVEVVEETKPVVPVGSDEIMIAEPQIEAEAPIVEEISESPVETEETGSAEATAEEAAPEIQVANEEDTTDEIGAPIESEPDADKA